MNNQCHQVRPRWRRCRGFFDPFTVTVTLAVLAGLGMAAAIKNASQNAQNSRNNYNNALGDAADSNSNGNPNQAQQQHTQDIQTTGGQLIEQGIRTIPNGVGLPTTIKVLTTGSSVKRPNNNTCNETIHDNVKDTVQSNVKDTVTDTVKDNVKDNIKTGVKDTCSDGCKDTVRSTTRDTVRSTSRDCGGGGNCR